MFGRHFADCCLASSATLPNPIGISGLYFQTPRWNGLTNLGFVPSWYLESFVGFLDDGEWGQREEENDKIKKQRISTSPFVEVISGPKQSTVLD